MASLPLMLKLHPRRSSLAITPAVIIGMLLGHIVYGLLVAITYGILANSLSHHWQSRHDAPRTGMFDIVSGSLSADDFWIGEKRECEQVHSKWRHSYAKMIGCFLGSGLMLSIAGAIGISPGDMFR